MHINDKAGIWDEETTNWGYTFRRARFACINRQRMYLAPLLTSEPPVYSGKNLSRGTWRKTRWVKAERGKEIAMEYLGELSLEYIDLVQEKNDRCAQEPP
jgi:hypothetical protein